MLLVAGLAAAAAPAARGNGIHGPAPPAALPTRFEALVAESCAPCVTESWAVATVPTPAQKPAGFGPQVLNTMSRAGEIRLEVVRAQPLGRSTQRYLAVRVVLAVASGGGQFYRFATGLLDEEDLPAMTAAVSALAKAVAAPPTAGPEPQSTQMEYHAGSVRVGVLRVPGTTLGYVQAGDVHALGPPTPFDANAVVFFRSDDLGVLLDALAQAAERLGRLRAP